MHVRNLIIILTILTSTFAFTSFVQADGEHQNNISNAVTDFQGSDQQPPSTEDPHAEMNHGDGHDAMTKQQNDDHSSTPQSEQQSGHSDSGHDEEGHGDESVAEETPPNYKVLGTFGLINFSFLSLGAILKIRKRKEKLYEVKSKKSF